jgi:hypothetical protein
MTSVIGLPNKDSSARDTQGTHSLPTYNAGTSLVWEEERGAINRRVCRREREFELIKLCDDGVHILCSPIRGGCHDQGLRHVSAWMANRE